MKVDLSAANLRSLSPVEIVDTGSDFDSGIPIAGIGLCLSGGGYRATLFHLGVLWRLNQVGYLNKIDRISSVSGGSILSGVLGLNWSRLAFDASGVGAQFVSSRRRTDPQTLRPHDRRRRHLGRSAWPRLDRRAGGQRLPEISLW